MKRRRRRLTAKRLARLRPEEQELYLLLREEESRPKLFPMHAPSSPLNPDELRQAIELGFNAPPPTAEDKQEAFAWLEARGWRENDLSPVDRGMIRLLRREREDLLAPGESPAENPGLAAAKAAAIAQAEAEATTRPPSQPREVVEGQNEAPMRPVIQKKEQEPRDIFEALNRPTRDSQQVGESYGSWHRKPI
jgi:hypothetical protein